VSAADRPPTGLPGEPEAFDRGVMPPPVQDRGLISIDGALALIAVLLVVQMWLLTAALESLLAGHHEGSLPAAIVSGVIAAACGALYLFIGAVDADVRNR
jgi:hypothetical protein